VTVRGELDPIGEPVPQVVHEHLGVVHGPRTNEPGRDELRVGADRRPRPDVAIAERVAVLIGDVLLLGVAVGPDRSSHSMRVQGRSVSAPSGYSAHASPRSTKSLVIVFFAAPVTRTVGMPSTRQPTICVILLPATM